MVLQWARSGEALTNSPAFGQADLSNCERELIHLAGSIQPHGALLVLDPKNFRVVQASANCASVLSVPAETLVDSGIGQLGAAFGEYVRTAAAELRAEEVRPQRIRLGGAGPAGARPADFDVLLHRNADQFLIVEFEALQAVLPAVQTVSFEAPVLVDIVAAGIERISAASNQGMLFDAVVQIVRDLTGYDRVMVYKFDPDGHGKIIAEARHPRLDTLLGHHYPASDIPQRARELYLRTRLRVLVDVHYQPVPIEPRMAPGLNCDLDMSLCYLRSMSPLHLQYLKNMGVNATLVISLVHEGKLWGLIACHHDTPRNLRYPVRASCEMLAEIVATRLAAIENYAHAQVDILVRRLEQRLIEATSTEGDWRLALFRNPRALLQPLEASGAALFIDNEVLSGGEVPSTPELRALLQWIDTQTTDSLFACSSTAKANPKLSSITAVASGVLAVKLADSRPDYLVWFRKEQLQTVTWAGDPSKPMVSDNPLELSPRRSFAAWSEIVRGTALPWSSKELLFARAIGSALIDIIAQVNAVRLLIAEHQIAQVRASIGGSKEPVLVIGAASASSFANAAFCTLVGRDGATLQDLARAGIEALAPIFIERDTAAHMLRRLRTRNEPWRGDFHVARPHGEPVPVSLRAEPVPGQDGAVLGFIIIMIDRTERRRAVAALQNLEQLLARQAGSASPGPDPLRSAGTDELMGALLANASMAAMDISEFGSAPAVVPMLQELETSLQRATALYQRIQSHSATQPRAATFEDDPD